MSGETRPSSAAGSIAPIRTDDPSTVAVAVRSWPTRSNSDRLRSASAYPAGTVASGSASSSAGWTPTATKSTGYWRSRTRVVLTSTLDMTTVKSDIRPMPTMSVADVTAVRPGLRRVLARANRAGVPNSRAGTAPSSVHSGPTNSGAATSRPRNASPPPRTIRVRPTCWSEWP